MSTMEETSNWHRKWLVLAAVLGWVFLYRYRVMGWVLSQAVTYQMSKSGDFKRAPVTVRVERVTIHPPRFLNVELSSSGLTSWRLVLSSVTVQTHVKEFFESFGQVKVCVLVIDEIRGEVEKVDEKQLQELLLPKQSKTKNATAMSRPKMNPVCFMRFVDLKVESIRLRVDCLEATTEFLCYGLFMGITDVFVKRDMLQFKLQARSVVVKSYVASQGRSFVWSSLIDGQGESDGREGIYLDIPGAGVVLDLNLTNQRFLGCKMQGCKEQTAKFVASTAFVERALTTRNELIRKGLASLVETDTVGIAHTARSVDNAAPQLTIEINEFHFAVTVVNEVKDIGHIPLQLSAAIQTLSYTKKIGHLRYFPGEGRTSSEDIQVHSEALLKNVIVNILGDSEAKLLSMNSLEMNATQDKRDRGAVNFILDNIECFLSHRSDTICRSLMDVQERMKQLQTDTNELRRSALINRSKMSSHGVTMSRNTSIRWDAEVEVSSWTLSFGKCPKEGQEDELVVCGTKTSICMPLSPTPSENGSLCIKRSILVQQITVDMTPSGLSAHAATFGGAEVVMMVVLGTEQDSKLNIGAFKFDYVSINGLLPEINAEATRFPAIYLHQVKIEREMKITSEVTEVDMNIHFDDTKVEWNYQQHKTFLVEWAAMKNIIDQLDNMMSASSTSRRKCVSTTASAQSGHSSQPPLKIMNTNVCSKHTSIVMSDIPGVAPSASFNVVDVKASHRETQLSATISFNCTNADLRWGASSSIIVMTNASFQNRKCLGRQRYLTKVPVQSDIRFNSLKMHLRPQSRMLLLFQRLDQLISGPSKKSESVQQTLVQGISFGCGVFTAELQGGESLGQAARIVLITFDVKMTRCTPREITETLVRLANSLGKDRVSGRTFEEVAHQVTVMEGTTSASAITVDILSRKLVALHHAQIHFSMTDVEWSRIRPLDQSDDESQIVPRTISFDLSVLTERMHLVMARYPLTSLLRLTPIIQEAFDTKESQEAEQAVADRTNFRQRYVGNFDLAFVESEIVCPYGDDSSRKQIGNKVMRVSFDEVAFKLRQFQVLEFRCSPLRIMLEDDVSTRGVGSGTSRFEDALQLLFIPEVKVHSVIHWQNSIRDCGQQQFALSLDVLLGNTAPTDLLAKVPLADEALIALNWDCVYPWLIYMATDDEDIDSADQPLTKSPPATDSAKRFQCIGVKWDVSITLVQIAWWDTVTQEVGMLVVASEFLTHGVMRTENSIESFALGEDAQSQPQWRIWDTTVFLTTCRGYLLLADDGDASADAEMSNVLPFASELPSNFSLEMVGTSYRDMYTPDDDEDWESLDDEVTAVFAPSSSAIFESVNEQFVPIDNDFSDVTAQNICKPGPAGRLPLLHVPVSMRTSTNPSKSPRSPKNGHSARNKLSRLKRRSTAMDNLFSRDGSCPIQVDSMRLLWTLQTRDSVFYMVSTTLDSLQLLVDAKRRSKCLEPDSGIAAPNSPSRRLKRSSFRPPSICSNISGSEDDNPSTEMPRNMSRRGSTRETLLDLLHQGKLGMTQDSDRESSTKSLDEDSKSERGSIGEQPSAPTDGGPRTIAVKAYTVDIHDVQINVREEGTRSNMLLASKHIHFEIGSDASDNNTIANLTFDNVTAHVAPIDVDITAGVLWYSHSDANSPAGSALLKQIMEECSLTTTYIHNRATAGTNTEVDLSFLQLSTDRHQFYQLLNVIRHVLLAPPSMTRRPKRTYTPKFNSPGSPQSPQTQEGGDIMIFMPPSPTSTMISTSTKKFHVLLEEELRNREIRTRGTSSRSNTAMSALKAISFKVVGMQWRLRLSPEISGADHEFVEIRIQGFTGRHTYYKNHVTKLTLNLQWLEVNNLHPGPSSAAFEDSMAVLKAKLLVDKRFESGLGNQKGMLVVRAESGPIVRVLGQKLRVLEVLEVSMFPEVSNMIVIQLAADFYDLIDKFFFANASSKSASSNTSSEQVFFGRKGASSPITGSSVAIQKAVSSPHPRARASTMIPSQSTLRPLHMSSSANNNSTNNMFSESSSNLAGGANSPTASSASEDITISDESDSTEDDCELFYVKYVRVGNVRLRINCNGFFVNLSRFDLDLPPYVCQSKLCTTKKLLQKFESHLKWYITKESASSGLSQFKNKLLKWTPSSSSASDKKDKNKKQEEDTAAANAQVLFGPYSGSPT